MGVGILTTYTSTSAKVLPMRDEWPVNSAIVRSPDRPTLVLALHPRCVCSRATIEELARLLARVPVPQRVEILLYKPETAPSSWGRTDLVVRAGSLPGVTIHPDVNGREADRFALSVSGQAALYAPSGQLLFTGGITPGRGHEGDNAGRDALISLLSKRLPDTSSTPVFGCSIRRAS